MTRYELTERIGVGAMAEIFRGTAIADSGFEKPVAIKRILPHLSQDRRFVEILIAEANMVSHLRHRNIVQVFDVGVGPDGHYFVVMEFVNGADLRALQLGLESAGRRLPLDLGLYISAEICDALDHAYRAPGPDGKELSLVHRDVSPSNVLLSRSGEVKLTDFGIAKRAEEVTSHGGVRGKFAYISPEQASGKSVDGRSDVFSVGILLFEMVLGRRLFSNMADYEALQSVVEGRVPRPRSIDPNLDARLEMLMLKALGHRPDQRFSSAGELGKALRDYRYSLPSTGSDPAQELATAVGHFGELGKQRYAQVQVAAPLPPQPDDFSGNSSSFTLEGEDSLVRRQSFAEARKLVHELEEAAVAPNAADAADAADTTEDRTMQDEPIPESAQASADLQNYEDTTDMGRFDGDLSDTGDNSATIFDAPIPEVLAADTGADDHGAGDRESSPFSASSSLSSGSRSSGWGGTPDEETRIMPSLTGPTAMPRHGAAHAEGRAPQPALRPAGDTDDKPLPPRPGHRPAPPPLAEEHYRTAEVALRPDSRAQDHGRSSHDSGQPGQEHAHIAGPPETLEIDQVAANLPPRPAFVPEASGQRGADSAPAAEAAAGSHHQRHHQPQGQDNLTGLSGPSAALSTGALVDSSMPAPKPRSEGTAQTPKSRRPFELSRNVLLLAIASLLFLIALGVLAILLS